MNVKRWIARREPSWQEFDALLRQAEKKGLRSLQTQQVKQLASLYRSISADLARARTNQVSDALVQQLQSLTSRGYSQIYQGSRRQDWQAVAEFYRTGFPAIVRETWVYIAIAAALFIFGGLIGWWFSWQDSAFLALVVPDSIIDQVLEDGELWMGSILGIEPVASSSIMVNNIRVSLLAIFGGVTMYLAAVPMITPPGTFTIFILFMNGLLIGAVSTLVAQGGLAYPFWAFVFPHGSLELPAIFLAGGAGLLLARSILFPGQLKRVDALRCYGTKAAKLVYGLIPLMVIAGVIEGFFSPNPAIPDVVKYVTGAGLFALLMVYWSSGLPASKTVSGQDNT
jgi:uncharacterized membrane protein SpoIIM required for sporulation